MHGVFDIVGPVMIGPSSSHTAGAVRLGLMARKILGEKPIRVEINLHGSFARTGKGHGTDKALLAGIMGMEPDDMLLREALELAEKQGISYEFKEVELQEAHPNSAVIYLVGENGGVARVRGASVGGGNILITNIDGYGVELSGQYPALLTIHRDRPGVITEVTRILARYEVNIAFMRVSRQSRGKTAMMIMELDDEPAAEVVEECSQVCDVELARAVPAV